MNKQPSCESGHKLQPCRSFVFILKLCIHTDTTSHSSDEFFVRDATGRPSRQLGRYGNSLVEVVTFGDTVDSFLDLFGYDVTSILQIQTAWGSSSCIEEFIYYMGKHNMPPNEAAWFWNEITKEGDVGNSFRERQVIVSVE